MWQFPCWELERYFSPRSSEISQLGALTLVYFYPLCRALGGGFSPPGLSDLPEKFSWIILMKIFSLLFSLPRYLFFFFFLNFLLFELFLLNKNCLGFLILLKNLLLLCSNTYFGGVGGRFPQLLSSKPAIEFLNSTLSKIFFFLFSVSFYSIRFPYLSMCFWGY